MANVFYETVLKTDSERCKSLVWPISYLFESSETQNGRYFWANTVTSRIHISKEEILLPIVWDLGDSGAMSPESDTCASTSLIYNVN